MSTKCLKTLLCSWSVLSKSTHTVPIYFTGVMLLLQVIITWYMTHDYEVLENPCQYYRSKEK